MKGRTHSASIRVRITLIAAVAVTAVMTIASMLLVSIQREQLTSNVDTALRQRADDIASLFGSATSGLVDIAAGSDEGFAQVVDSTGTVVASTPNLAGEPPLPIDGPLGNDRTIRTVEGLAVDDDVFRVLTQIIDLPGEHVVLHVGATIDVVEESVAVLLGTLGVTIPLVVTVVAALVWWLVGRTLLPVEAIRREVAEIGSLELHRRVPMPPHADEISRLAGTMNDMLDRVEVAVARQQRFVADASHELRSPLTRLRSELDLERGGAGGDREVVESLLEDVTHLQQLVDDLLVLAQNDAGRTAVGTTLVDLDDVVLREAQAMREGGRITVDMAAVSAAQVVGDAPQLGRAIRNLCDNARRHAASLVKLSLREVGDRAVFIISDDGPGIPPDQADAVFERFARLDDARNSAMGGTGLGLAIAREIIERHGGRLDLDTDHVEGASFVLELPLA